MKDATRAKKPKTSQGRRQSQRKKPGRGAFRFTEAKGKTVEFVEFYTGCDYHCVEIGFDDRTAMHFTIEPSFSVEPGYSSWKTGNERVLRRWALIRSA